jgi:hypothetical protein
MRSHKSGPVRGRPCRAWRDPLSRHRVLASYPGRPTRQPPFAREGRALHMRSTP